ncbi:MAG: hypothetical protein SFW36_09360 [Leptolyngbyaceae cyanobacterium bins.59]|nr:hypothetical protein [Leptolyngbyaceae cyanobacterium bins.59]
MAHPHMTKWLLGSLSLAGTALLFGLPVLSQTSTSGSSAPASGTAPAGTAAPTSGTVPAGTATPGPAGGVVSPTAPVTPGIAPPAPAPIAVPAGTGIGTPGTTIPGTAPAGTTTPGAAPAGAVNGGINGNFVQPGTVPVGGTGATGTTGTIPGTTAPGSFTGTGNPGAAPGSTIAPAPGAAGTVLPGTVPGGTTGGFVPGTPGPQRGNGTTGVGTQNGANGTGVNGTTGVGVQNGVNNGVNGTGLNGTATPGGTGVQGVPGTGTVGAPQSLTFPTLPGNGSGSTSQTVSFTLQNSGQANGVGQVRFSGGNPQQNVVFQLPPGSVISPNGLVSVPTSQFGRAGVVGNAGGAGVAGSTNAGTNNPAGSQFFSFQLPPGTVVTRTGRVTVPAAVFQQSSNGGGIRTASVLFDRRECERGQVFVNLSQIGGGACLFPNQVRNLR